MENEKIGWSKKPLKWGENLLAVEVFFIFYFLATQGTPMTNTELNAREHGQLNSNSICELNGYLTFTMNHPLLKKSEKSGKKIIDKRRLIWQIKNVSC